MSPFWGSFYEHLKSCGRDATYFVLALAGLFIVLVATVIANSMNLFQYADQILAVFAVVVVVRLCLMANKIRKRGQERFRPRPLSRDEMRVARSKLLKDKNMNNFQPRY